GMLDFGDKADTLATDCAAAKAKLMKSNPTLTAKATPAATTKPGVGPTVGSVKTAAGTTTGSVKTAAGTTKSGDTSLAQVGSKARTWTAMTPAKQQCLVLVAEARRLMGGKNPDYVAARAKAMEARKLAETGRCAFTPAEDSPDVCLQHIQAEGKKQV